MVTCELRHKLLVRCATVFSEKERYDLEKTEGAVL